MRLTQEQLEQAIDSLLSTTTGNEKQAILQLVNDLSACNNELCLRCNRYTTQHLGSCDGCKWKMR